MARVAKGSLAERAGLAPGDRLVSINGHVLRDVIDYHYYGADEELELEIERAGKGLASGVRRRYGEEFGLEFTEDVFDGIRRCNNHCAFCFVDQMPPGMRESLYLKDDDYRYSFLHGNFITLCNWTDEDWERVAEQRLSPLYISVHASDLGLRRRILGNPQLPDILVQLGRLGELGVEMHTQIVVLPGLNDGAQLEQTLDDLTSLYPAVRSVGVVPLGLTKYHRAGLRVLTVQEERAIMEQIVPRQAQNRRRLGIGLVYPSDELYLRAGFPVPPAKEYDGFPQLENGIGLVRRMLDEWEKIKADGMVSQEGRVVAICGTLIAPLLDRVAQELSHLSKLDISVVPVENAFFGLSVTVSGLLVGQEVVEAVRDRDLGDMVLLPRAMFDAQGEVTLDDLTAEEMESRLGVAVRAASSVAEMLGCAGGKARVAGRCAG